ncbi:MAG: hypothetical protein M1817_001095 [Caeruleum heppii]|nr:MAG: hypothetical protein M1817_001095 [Caeruleum heppii]
MTPNTAYSTTMETQTFTVQTMQDEQREAQAGITEVVNPGLTRFTGILKQRYTDFLVNEILPSGEVVHLRQLRPQIKPPAQAKSVPETSQSQPSPPPAAIVHEHQKTAPDHAEPDIKDDTLPVQVTSSEQAKIGSENESGSTDSVISANDRAELISYFGSEVETAIVDLYQKALASAQRSADLVPVKSAQIPDRPLRGEIHGAVRRIFSSKLETSTDDDGYITFTAASGGGQRNRQPNQNRQQWTQKPRPARPTWKDLGGDHLHFSLYKENKDTMEVMSYLAQQLRSTPKAFQFAGTKDRRAVTVQRASAYHLQADRVAGVNRSLRSSRVGDFEYKPAGLELGELAGNEFVITLRDCQFATPEGEDLDEGDLDGRVTLAKKVVNEAVTSLQENGFINYYGLQRFGSFTARTDTIGLKMLQQDFKGACEDILSYTQQALAATDEATTRGSLISSDDRARARALHNFKTNGSSQSALQRLPRKFSAEANIIRHLGGPTKENDFQGALQGIQKNLRAMYVHAYQSLVWNVVAGERWKRHSNKVVEGDLVLIDKQASTAVATEQQDEVDQDGEIVVQPAQDDASTSVEDLIQRARPLTKEEAQSGQYSIFDIVLPTPGFDIVYPPNSIGEVYRSFMASDRGGGLDPDDMRRKWKVISLPGSYRKLLARPLDAGKLKVEVRPYIHDHEQMVETDLGRIQKGFQGNGGASENGPPSGNGSADKPRKLALIVKVQLGTSQYATMALRELMGPGGAQSYKPDFGGGR